MARPLRIGYPGAYYHVMNRAGPHGSSSKTKVRRFISAGQLGGHSMKRSAKRLE